MPRPIPDDVENVTGFIWYLIPVPDDPVFVQAAWDAFSQLTYPWNWGKEGRVPESDVAAQLWSDAIYEALRVRDMGFPDDILTYIDEVETLLQSILDKDGCCDDAVYDVVTDPDGVVQPLPDETGQDIEWDVGTPPGGAVDWAAATLERCAAAERFAANLDQWVVAVQVMHALPTLGLLVALSYFIAAMASIGLGIAVVGGAFGVAGAYSFLQGLRDLFELGPNYELAKTELNETDTIAAVVCAIIQSDTAAEAENAIDAALSTEAPAAAPMIELLPLRWIMGRLFNLDADAGSFGGPCRTCPDVTLLSSFLDLGTNHKPYSAEWTVSQQSEQADSIRMWKYQGTTHQCRFDSNQMNPPYSFPSGSTVRVTITATAPFDTGAEGDFDIRMGTAVGLDDLLATSVANWPDEETESPLSKQVTHELTSTITRLCVDVAAGDGMASGYLMQCYDILVEVV